MSLSGTFNKNQGPASLPASAHQRRKRGAPFSLRFSEDERARLTAEAGGAPLGAHIKAKLLGGSVPVRMRRSGLVVEDRQALGKALALLGQSRLASNLNQLAHLAHIGALPVSPEIESELKNAVSEVRHAIAPRDRARPQTGRRGMILKGSQRGGGQDLAQHLTRLDDNEHMESPVKNLMLKRRCGLALAARWREHRGSGGGGAQEAGPASGGAV